MPPHPNAPADRGVRTRGIPSATHVDHVAYTVPDLDDAIRFFTEALGADLVYREEPVRADDDAMRQTLNVHPRAVAEIAMLRLGPVTNVELFAYHAPDQRRLMPRNSDYGGHHLSFHVTDIDAAADHLRAQPGVRVLGEPRTVASGPIAGMRWVYFLTPWGMQMELSCPPARLPYEESTVHRRFSLADRGV